MKMHVIYDEDGYIIATAESSRDPDALSVTPLPSPGQTAAEFDVPEDCEKMTPLERHNSLQVDLRNSSPTLVARADLNG
jgi:hypothetical protein